MSGFVGRLVGWAVLAFIRENEVRDGLATHLVAFQLVERNGEFVPGNEFSFQVIGSAARSCSPKD
jgi:hypothetical protein